MALIKAKPTSPGRRFVVSVKTPGLHKGKPFAGLLEKKSRTGGRNNAGRITTRHIGGGHKQHYRVIDFKRNKDGIDAVVERIEYDPNRSAHIALLKYMDGERRYIIAPKGVAEGTKLRSGDDAGIRSGNCLPLRNIPVGSIVHCIELKPGKGAQIARSAGTSAQFVARDGAYSTLRCVPARCVKCCPTVARLSAKSVTASTACVHWVRLVPRAGAVFVRPCAVWR